jgi:hydroxymethylbilane synthase
MTHIRIGSRGSELALWQANHVKRQLEQLGCSVDIIVIKTQGDAIQHLSFDKLEGKGFFTKEIEQALLDNSVDLAVHSHKDLETTPPVGLIIAASSARFKERC